MGRSLRIGTAFGIGLYVHWTFLLIVVLVLANAWSGQVAAALAILPVFGCVVLHELGHALMARSFGIGTRDIILLPIGGIARLERMSDRPGEEIAIAFAGPLVNVVISAGLGLGMFLAGVLHWSGEWLTFGGSITHQVLFYLLAWNIFMALFNLIPAFPMDGGRVLRAFLAMGFGQLRGTEIAVAISKVLAVGFIVVGFYWHEFFLPVIGLFLMVAGSQELAMLRYQARQRSRPITIDQPPMVRPAEPTFSPAPPTQPNFSGFLWDARAGAWIEWRNGQAVGATYVNGTGPR